MSEQYAPNNEIQTRTELLIFQPGTWDPETRTIGFSISSGQVGTQKDPRTGAPIDEVLSVEQGAVETSRVDAGVCTVQTDHGKRFESLDGPTKPIPTVETTVGRVLEGSIAYEPGRVVGRMFLTTADDAKPVVQRIVDGTLRGISPGYKTLEYTDTPGVNGGRTLRTVTKWQLWEVSVTPIPMDSGANTRSATMEDPMEGTNVGGTVQTPAAAVVPAAMTPEMIRSIANEALRIQDEKRDIAQRAGVDLSIAVPSDAMEAERVIRAGISSPDTPVEAVRKAAFELLAAKTAALNIRAGQSVEITADEFATRFECIGAALAQRMGVLTDGELIQKASRFRGLDGVGLMRQCLMARGANMSELDAMDESEIVRRAFLQPMGPALSQRDGGAHMTADFTSVFANVLQKRIAAPAAISGDYLWWEKFGHEAPFDSLDPKTLVDFGGIEDLAVVKEGAEYTYVTMGDGSISYYLVKYGKLLALTREMMLKNGGLAMFANLLQLWLNSSLRTRSAACADAIFGNPLMQDGKALFTSAAWSWDKKMKTNSGGHANLSTSGGAPTIARLNELDTMLANQVDRAGSVVGQPAEFFLGPRAYKTDLDAIYDPKRQVLSAADSVSVIIPEANRLYIPSLAGTKPWVLGTGDKQGLEFGYLNGNNGPVVTQHPEYKNDSLVFQCMLEFAVVVPDCRALAMNPGQ
jgi:hypothetical protein